VFSAEKKLVANLEKIDIRTKVKPIGEGVYFLTYALLYNNRFQLIVVKGTNTIIYYICTHYKLGVFLYHVNIFLQLFVRKRNNVIVYFNKSEIFVDRRRVIFIGFCPFPYSALDTRTIPPYLFHAG
jgi:hypothetical protein